MSLAAAAAIETLEVTGAALSQAGAAQEGMEPINQPVTLDNKDGRFFARDIAFQPTYAAKNAARANADSLRNIVLLNPGDLMRRLQKNAGRLRLSLRQKAQINLWLKEEQIAARYGMRNSQRRWLREKALRIYASLRLGPRQHELLFDAQPRHRRAYRPRGYYAALKAMPLRQQLAVSPTLNAELLGPERPEIRRRKRMEKKMAPRRSNHRLLTLDLAG